jgi:predicted Fe-Mo cluster-binding NifX family protein
MKVAVTAMADSPEAQMDPRFGRAKWFVMIDDATGAWEAVDNEQNLMAAQGAGIQAAATVVNAGGEVLISGHCGPKAFKALTAAGVAVYRMPGGCTVAAAVEAYRNGTLKKLDDADVEGHW